MSDSRHPTLLSPKSRVQAKVGFVKDQSAHVSAQELPSPLSALEHKENSLPIAITFEDHKKQHKVSLLVKALRLRSTSVPERYQAAEALAALGPDAQSARSALETALLRDESVHVRKSAARALGDLGDKKAQPVLRQVLENDQDKFVRMRAREALDVLNSQTAK